MDLLSQFKFKDGLYVAEPIRRFIRVPITVDGAGNKDESVNPSHDFVIDHINCYAYGTGAVALTNFRFGILDDAKKQMFDELREGGEDITHPLASQVLLTTPEFRDVPPLYMPLYKNVLTHFRVSHVGTHSSSYTVELLLHVRRIRKGQATAQPRPAAPRQ